ncbi:hypothetical protein B0T22DRAFT_154950 [Podospora appendiculata]|uniref:Uncharacterized protein n=1 Tax=Podospora appendiculata TaxID=314037 RepID=A0AAE1CCC6_9PEZI|nr:hypothetical protein B0T22DRAFT_154950 [Podospora appendiculata]
MAHCADDYYSISGSCCPSGFAPWTTVLGDQTPCYRTLDRTTMTTPPLTSTRNPSRTSKPTVVYSNVVYAMQYAVQESEGGGGLSAGAIAGITIGTLLGVLGIGGLVYFLYRRHRSAQRIPDFKSEIRSGYYGPDPSEAPTSERGAQRSEVSSSSLARDVGLQHDGTRSPHQNQPSERRVQKKPSNAGSNRVLEPMPSQGQTPSDRDEQDEGYPPQSGTSSPLETQGILEVSLARPQRLSRGYARIVYTNPQGSSSSVPTKGSMDSRREGSMNIKGSMDSRRGDRVTSLNLAPRPCRGED